MAVGQRFVEIALDRNRKVRYSVNAMREIEQIFGGGFKKLFNPEDMGFDHITTLLFVGLKHGDPANRKAIPTVDKLADVLQKHWFDAEKGDLSDLVNIVVDSMKAGGVLPKDTDLEAVEVDDEGRVFIVETARQRLQVYRKQVASFHGGPL